MIISKRDAYKEAQFLRTLYFLWTGFKWGGVENGKGCVLKSFKHIQGPRTLKIHKRAAKVSSWGSGKWGRLCVKEHLNICKGHTY